MIAGLEQSGMTRTAIAPRSGLSRNTIWRAATGMWREPDHESVAKVGSLYERTLHRPAPALSYRRR